MLSNAGRTAQVFAHEWQPRLGFSWDLGPARRHRFFGSYGRFYQQNPLSLSTVFYNDYNLVTTYFSTDPRAPGALADSSAAYFEPESLWAIPQAGLEVEHYDEFTAGYERLLGAGTRMTIRGVRRTMGSAFLQVWDSTSSIHLGTPGRGNLDFLPFPERQYAAFEVNLDGAWRRVRYRVSYVLSRTKGNYTGLYASDTYAGLPGQNTGLFFWYQGPNSSGLLPNDRTHALKVVATWSVFRSTGLGVFASWMSGTPLSEFGKGPVPWTEAPMFLAKRGSVGRTPAIVDVNLRLSHEIRRQRGGAYRLVLDLLHVGNPQRTVRQDMQHFRSLDSLGNQANPNPDYLRATAFQPPMTARLGVELGF
jgi:hypothetical protein